MENGLLTGLRALSIPFNDFEVFNPSDLFANTTGDFALGTGANAATMARYAIGGPFCFFEFQAQFGVSPTLGANGFNLTSVRLPVPALPAPTAELVGGTNSVSDLLSGSNVCVGNAHLTTSGESKSADLFPALFQAGNGPHPPRQSAIFLPIVKRFTISGTATVASGAKVASVTHGHLRAPALQDISIVPQGSWQTPACTQWWPDTVAATTFNLNATGAAAANLGANLIFNWQATITGSFLWSQSFPFDVNAGGQLKGSMMYRWR